MNAAASPRLWRMRDDVVDAERPGDLDRAVAAAVVDHEPLDDVDARDLAGQIGDGERQRLLLVEARDLDDQLDRCRHHGAA